MKNQNKLFLMAIMLIGIATVTNTFAQTLGKFGRGNGSNFVDSSTPIFEDITNSRIGIGTLSPSKTLTVSGDANVTGSFGIGTTSLSNKLEVNGDINVASSNGYKIGNSTLPVLWHNGNPVNLFVGDGAGNTSLTSSSYTTLVGYNAGHALSDGHTNTYVGYNSGSLGLHGYSNTGVGFQALKKTEAYGGCAFGLNAAFSNVGGCSLIAVGENALYKNFTGNDNSAIGHYAMYNNTELGDNIAIGDAALFTQDWAPPSGTCPDNPTYGYPTGCKSSNNVAVGNKALWWNNPTSTGVDPTNGINNSALGTLALYNNRNGYGNTANGYYAGYTNQTGYNNTFLGFNTDVGTYNLNNAAAIGANAITKNSNEMILRDPSVYVGIGYSGVAAFPPGKLSVDENAGKVPTPTIAGFFHNGDVTTDATYTFQKKAVYAYCDGLFANESGG